MKCPQYSIKYIKECPNQSSCIISIPSLSSERHHSKLSSLHPIHHSTPKQPPRPISFFPLFSRSLKHFPSVLPSFQPSNHHSTLHPSPKPSSHYQNSPPFIRSIIPLPNNLRFFPTSPHFPSILPFPLSPSPFSSLKSLPIKSLQIFYPLCHLKNRYNAHAPPITTGTAKYNHELHVTSSS